MFKRQFISGTVIQPDGEIEFTPGQDCPSMLETYDLSFLLITFLCNFLKGLRRLLEVGLLLIFHHFNYEQSEIKALHGIIVVPYFLKIILGVLADNYSVYESRRKSYLMISCIINVFVLAISIVCFKS